MILLDSSIRSVLRGHNTAGGVAAGRDYLTCSRVVSASESQRQGLTRRLFCWSRKPESNRRLRVDESGVLPLHHHGTVDGVCRNSMSWHALGRRCHENVRGDDADCTIPSVPGGVVQGHGTSPDSSWRSVRRNAVAVRRSQLRRAMRIDLPAVVLHSPVSRLKRQPCSVQTKSFPSISPNTERSALRCGHLRWHT